MSIKTTKKSVMDNYLTISVGYCELTSLLAYTPKIAHTEGVYGWNANIYLMPYPYEGTVIVTGYRPFGEISPCHELLKKYEQKAKSLFDKDEINKLLLDFVKEVLEV